MQQLLNETNVKVVVNETQVPGALSSFGVLPAASVSTPLATIYAIRRDVPDASYFYLFNSGNTTENFTLSLRTDIPGTPFFLDAFTGKVSPVALWTNDSGAISIPSLSLAPTESALFAVSSADTFEGVGVPNVHLSALDSPAVAVGNADGSIEVQSTSDGVFNYTLSTGDTGSVNVTLGGETTRTLSGWQLSIVAWTPPQNLSSIEPVLVPQPVFNLTQGLVPWNTLAGQANTSGVGTYNTTFDWDAHSDTVGAKLNFGTVFHTIKAFVNDVQIPTADPTSPVVDITQFVATGSNTLRVEAASTLLNAVNAVRRQNFTLYSHVYSSILRPNTGAPSRILWGPTHTDRYYSGQPGVRSGGTGSTDSVWSGVDFALILLSCSLLNCGSTVQTCRHRTFSLLDLPPRRERPMMPGSNNLADGESAHFLSH